MSNFTGPERSIGELFGDLANETSTLVRQEVKLATSELAQKATYAGKQAGYIAAGSLLAVASFFAFLAALVLGMGTFMPPWTAAIAVGIVIGAASYLIARKGVIALKQMDPAPKQTIQSMKENKLWVQDQVR